MVTIFPNTAAGPETTLNTTGSPELAEANTKNGASPMVRPESEPNITVWDALLIIKLWLTLGAAA
jgi:hypothetical protein